MDEVRPHGELPIEGKLDGGYVRTRPCHDAASAVDGAECVCHRFQRPPVKSRQLVFQRHSGDSLPYRRMTEELLEGRDRLLHIVGPDLYGHTAIDLPRNPSDVG